MIFCRVFLGEAALDGRAGDLADAPRPVGAELDDGVVVPRAVDVPPAALPAVVVGEGLVDEVDGPEAGGVVAEVGDTVDRVGAVGGNKGDDVDRVGGLGF